MLNYRQRLGNKNFRMNNRRGDEKQNHFTFLDLFCGAGGLTQGFEKGGFHCLGAADLDKAAIETHCKNFSAPAWRLDLSNTSSLQLPQTDVVIGGAPCQGFSSAGMRQISDERNDLVAQFARIVSELRPRTFVFENVESFLTAGNGHYVFALLRPLIACGYRIHARKVNAANYGVPQHRKRVIMIGGLGWEPSFPNATHTAFGAPGAALGGHSLPLTPTVFQALEGLPAATLDAPGTLQGHFCRPLQETELARATALLPGQSMRDLPQNLQHESFTRRAYRRVVDGTPTERRGGPPTGVRRLRADEPSKAITGGARAEFLHPYEHRPLTLRECARLQTFPDNFTFCGTASQQSQLIGNAVPPLFAQVIAESIRSDLELSHSEIECQDIATGQLLSFVPTLSQGTSPALKNVIEAVRSEFGILDGMSPQAVTKELTLWR